MFDFWPFRRRKPREIFSWVLDGRRRFGDPMIIRERFLSHPEWTPVDLGLIDQDDDFGRAAYKRTVDAARQAFDLPPLDADGRGATEEEALAVLAEFLDWRAALKKNSGTPPTSPPSTDCPPDSSATKSG